jgi:hypothetical protein
MLPDLRGLKRKVAERLARGLQVAKPRQENRLLWTQRVVNRGFRERCYASLGPKKYPKTIPFRSRRTTTPRAKPPARSGSAKQSPSRYESLDGISGTLCSRRRREPQPQGPWTCPGLVDGFPFAIAAATSGSGSGGVHVRGLHLRDRAARTARARRQRFQSGTPPSAWRSAARVTSTPSTALA